jgi:hypothetical protein
LAIKERVASWLLDWLMKNRPEQLRTAMKAATDKDVQAVALQTTMLYLDRMGLLHCAMCPQRYGLRSAVVEGRECYLCNAHFSKANQPVHSNGKSAQLEAI